MTSVPFLKPSDSLLYEAGMVLLMPALWQKQQDRNCICACTRVHACVRVQRLRKTTLHACVCARMCVCLSGGCVRARVCVCVSEWRVCVST